MFGDGTIIISNDMKITGTHLRNLYVVTFEGIPADKLKIAFLRKWQMEEAIYMSGRDRYTYVSSTGESKEMVFEYRPKEFEEYKDDRKEKYDYYDYLSGHFVREL